MTIKIIDTNAENDRKYEMMNGGINSQGFKVLSALGYNMSDVKRYRDAGYDSRRRRVWILTRTGSESHYPELNNHALEESPYFLKRYDEPTDATYELLIFKLPEGVTLKHVTLPNLGLIMKLHLKRQESGKLNPLEKEYAKKMADFLASE